MAERYVKPFRNGGNQAVRIPRECEPPGNQAVIRKEGKAARAHHFRHQKSQIENLKR
jgi:hypothetical protein